MSTPTAALSATLMTATEFVKRHENDRVELVEGEVKETATPSAKHGKICAKISLLLGNHVEEEQLGHVMTNDSFVKTHSNPDTVFGVDVCFYSYERLPKGDVPEGLLDVIPELAIEVRSPPNTWTEMFTKVAEYLRAGVKVVVVIDAATTSASVYQPEELQKTYHNGDELTLPEVLPGFSVVVRELFE